VVTSRLELDAPPPPQPLAERDELWSKLQRSRAVPHHYFYRPFTDRELPLRGVAPPPCPSWLPQVQQVDPVAAADMPLRMVEQVINQVILV
jgi:hypothetical protein